MSELNYELLCDASNEVVQFVLDCGYSDNGIEFLRCWNEGDWKSIEDEWPEFDIQSEAQQYLIKQSGGMNY